MTAFALIFTTNVPTPPNGRATIRLCRTLSLEQKLPLEVSFISLEMTCQTGRDRNANEPNTLPTECKKSYQWSYLAVVGIRVHTERLLLLIDEGDGCVQRVHGHHGKNRAQHVLLHDGIRFRHVRQNGRRFTKRVESCGPPHPPPPTYANTRPPHRCISQLLWLVRPRPPCQTSTAGL